MTNALNGDATRTQGDKIDHSPDNKTIINHLDPANTIVSSGSSSNSNSYNYDHDHDQNNDQQPTNNQDVIDGSCRTLDGELATDELAQDAQNYRILLAKIDGLLERLKLDA